MSDQTTRHWVVAYATTNDTLGAKSIWLDTPHGILVSTGLWSEAKKAIPIGGIVMALTPRLEKE